MGHFVTFLGAWTFDPAVVALLAMAAGFYAWGARTVSYRHPDKPWPGHHSACFYAGIVLLWVILLGPPGAFDDTFFWAHMVQHIVMVMICAPLLLLGAPILLILRVSSPGFRHHRLVPVLRSRAVSVLTSPTATWLLLALVVVGTHFSPFFELTLEHPNLHRFVEHPLYLGAALLYFYPLMPGNLGTRTISPATRMVSLTLMMVPETMTGFFIYASTSVMYPFYATVDRPFGPGPLTDQQLGGALMWAGSMSIDAAWITLAAHEWLLSETRRGRRLDVIHARQLGAQPHV